MGQFQELLEPVKPGAAIFRHLGPRVGSPDDGAKSNHEYIMQQMPGVVTPWVLEAIEMFAER
jgi:hypothetical protein